MEYFEHEHSIIPHMRQLQQDVSIKGWTLKAMFVGSGSHVLQLHRATISASECQKQLFLFPQNTGPCEKNTIWVLRWELDLNIAFCTYFFSFL